MGSEGKGGLLKRYITPVSGTPKYRTFNLGFHSAVVPRHSNGMGTATPFPRRDPAEREDAKSTFRATSEHAPVEVALCDSQKVIVGMNPAFEHTLERESASQRGMRVSDLVLPQDRAKTESKLREFLDSERDSIRIQASGIQAGPIQIGDVHLESQPGQGTRLTILLPLASSGAPDSLDSAIADSSFTAPATSQQIKKENIL